MQSTYRSAAVLLAAASLFAVSVRAQARAATLIAGDPGAVVSVAVLDWTSGPLSHQLLVDQVLLRAIDITNRTANEVGELGRTRVRVRDGVTWVEQPDCARLFVFERTTTIGHGLLYVQRDGTARIAFEGTDQLDIPLGIGTDGRHVAFARGDQLTIVRLDGSPFAGGSAVRVVATGAPILANSVVVGPSHVFFVTDDDRVHRCALAAGGPSDITPWGNGSVRQSSALALSGDGTRIAFLRGEFTSLFAVWVAGTAGPAMRMPLPEREYREPEYLPNGNGQPHLLLNHTGSRLMVTEIGIEDELHYVETSAGGTSAWVTQDANFSDYIGTHILPVFAGNRLLFASGHLGWRDWYAQQADGSVINVSMTGSPETPFLVGSLDVQNRYQLANGSSLTTEAVGSQQWLRWLDPAGGTAVIFQDLLEAPRVGGATTGWPDLRVIGVGGERLVRSTDGSVRLAAPPGIALTDPVRGPQGWTATWAHLAAGVGVLVVQLDDGSLLFGGVGVGIPQLGWNWAGDLTVLWPDRLETYSVTGSRLFPLGAVVSRIVSGAGY
jgi:hypothetical protein